jgi:hypothetical protein
MGMTNFCNRFRELTDTDGFLQFLLGARLRVGAFLDPPVEGGEVSSSGVPWGVYSLGDNFAEQYPTTLTGGRTATGVVSRSRPDSLGPESAGEVLDSSG